MDARVIKSPNIAKRAGTQRGGVRLLLLVLVAVLAGATVAVYAYRDVIMRQPWAEKGLAWVGITSSNSQVTDAAPPAAQDKAVYTCPMHPEVVSDKPGKCPKCGMFLEAAKPGAPADAPKPTPPPPPAKSQAAGAKYHCPMHPTYVSDRPGECPICGMNLVPIQEVGEMKGKGIPGHAPVKIAPEMQQLIGVKTSKAERRRISKTIRAVSIVGYDETKLATYTMRYGGWIDKLLVNYTGQLVEKGDPLATVYSPDLLLAQHEYLIALDAVEQTKPGYTQGGRKIDQDILEAAREKLRLYDVTDEQIAELAKSRKAQTYLPLHSPIRGYVTKRNVVKRSYMAMGQELYEIADLSTVWVNVDVYEYEMALVKLGQEATFEPTYEPGKLYKGKVTFIFPTLNNDTRTVTVRLEFPNPEMKLKPMMYGNARISVDLGEQLVADDSAIMFTGTEAIAFVALGDGYFEPRKVTVGPRTDNYYIIREGLKDGESVVVGANFLVDSESRLKAALTGMGAPAPVAVPEPAGAKPGGGMEKMPPMPGMQH